MGLVHHKIIAQTLTGQVFQTFIEELLLAASGPVAHRNWANWHIVVLPPYSPFLNPVECAHSCLKAAIKRELARPAVQLELDTPPPETTLHDWRVLVLQRLSEEATAEITLVKCGGWLRQMLHYVPRCIAGEVILQLSEA